MAIKLRQQTAYHAITPHSANELLEQLEQAGLERKFNLEKGCYGGSRNYFSNYYLLDNNRKILALDPNPDSPTFAKLTVFRVGNVILDDTDVVTDEFGNAYESAADVLERFSEELEEEYKDKYYIKHKFGTVDENLYSYMVSCVPGYLNYANPDNLGMVNKNINKADVSSAFAFEMSKPLPTMKDHLEYDYRKEPTASYPFAFYSDGTIAIYNEFNSSYWDRRVYSFVEAKLARDRRINDFEYKEKPANIKTILCKKSLYTLEAVINKIYQKKKKTNASLYKAMLNFTVGSFWGKEKPKYAHLAAVVIARCANRMLKAHCEIELKGGNVLLIATDAIAWAGPADLIETTKEKELGNLILEYENAELYMLGAKSYQIKCGDTYKTFWSGVRKEVKDLIPWCGIPADAANAASYFFFNKKKNRFIINEVI